MDVGTCLVLLALIYAVMYVFKKTMYYFEYVKPKHAKKEDYDYWKRGN